MDPRAFDRAAFGGDTGGRGRDEPFVFPPAFQGGDRSKPARLSQTNAPPGGSSATVRRTGSGRERGLRHRLRERVAIHSRVHPAIRDAAGTRRGPLARRLGNSGLRYRALRARFSTQRRLRNVEVHACSADRYFELFGRVKRATLFGGVHAWRRAGREGAAGDAEEDVRSALSQDLGELG
jgi:hypothetical protein